MIKCLSCKVEIGIVNKSIIVPNLKSVQKIDIDTTNGNLNLKCGSCNEWNSFINGVQGIDEKRKSREVLEYVKSRNGIFISNEALKGIAVIVKEIEYFKKEGKKHKT
jgi:hypothetical protein